MKQVFLILLVSILLACSRTDVGEGFGPHSFESPINIRKIDKRTVWIWFDDSCIAAYKGGGAHSWLRTSPQHSYLPKGGDNK